MTSVTSPKARITPLAESSTTFGVTPPSSGPVGMVSGATLKSIARPLLAPFTSTPR